MLFNSIDFAIFFPIVFILYWLVANKIKLRNIFLLAASYIFYGWWDWKLLSIIIISSIVDYIVGLEMGNTSSQKNKKLLLFISLTINLGFLVFFKYSNFFIDSFVDVFTLFGANLESPALNIILPVGISFYTFQTLSYTIDVYRGNLKPTKDISAFFAFVAFFPQLVAGPIERAAHLLPQFTRTHTFNDKSIKIGLQIMLWGLFKKMVIADRLAILVNNVYNNPYDHGGTDYLIATLFFAIQIYCDFSGYSDIAIGAARTMGFNLTDNFRSPYFSKSITEFWRRWHISLSTWFRDYVYIPLGGSRCKEPRNSLNLFIVFLVSGLWHGAALTFVMWGAIHGMIIVLEKITKNFRLRVFSILGLNSKTFSNRLFFGTITFVIVCIAWIFFRSNTISHAFHIFTHIFNFSKGMSIYELGLSIPNMNIAILSIIILITIEYANNKNPLGAILNRQSTILRWSVYVFATLSILLVGIYGSNTPEFIYFQF